MAKQYPRYRDTPDASTTTASKSAAGNAAAHPAEVANDLAELILLAVLVVGSDIRRKYGRRQVLEANQWNTLRRIARSPCTMSELAAYRVVSLPTASKSVDLFVRDGWVERSIDPADRRQTLVTITPKGRRALDKVRQETVRFLVEKLERLPADAREHLPEVIRALTQALTAVFGFASVASAI